MATEGNHQKINRESIQMIQEQIDKAMIAKQMAQEKRTYLGASRWGEECMRRLAYEYHHTPIDGEEDFPGKILRIFDMGHDGETRMTEYMRLAGFDLVTEKANGGQMGFYAMDGKLKGHCDGVITGGPVDLPYPLIWEHKALNDKSWADTKKKGVKESKPIYWSQIQTYCAYLDIPNGGLFTAINRNTGEIYSEHVEFDPVAAQALSDKAIRIVQTRSPEEMPKMSNDPCFYKCGWCSFRKRCHNIKEMTISTTAPAATQTFPSWLK